MIRPLLLFFLVLPSIGLAQSTDIVIDPVHVNLEFIRAAAGHKIDSLRKRNNVSALGVDPRLDSLARELVAGVARNAVLGSKGKWVIARHALLKGTTFQGVIANVASLAIHRPENDFAPIAAYYHINSTYHQTVDDVVGKLLATNRQARNILDPGVNAAGFALHYDTATFKLQVVMIVAKGGSPAVSPAREVVAPRGEVVTLPAERKLASYRIKGPRQDRSQAIVSRWVRARRRMPDGTMTTSFKRGKKTFRRWTHKTGIAYEVRQRRRYASDEEFHNVPSRLNQRSILNDNATGFVDAMKLMRQSRKIYFDTHLRDPVRLFKTIPLPFHKPPRTFYIEPSLPPVDSATVDNILIFRKGRLRGIIPIQPFPGNLKDVPYPLLPYPSFGNALELKSKTKTSKDTLSLRVNYARGEILPAGDDAEHMIRKIPLNRKVEKINIAAYASIEGTREHNAMLFQKRSVMIKDLLRKEGLLADSAILQTETMENWDVFYEQVKGDSLSWLRNETQDDARKYVNKHLRDSVILDWLDQQRYSEVVLILKDSTIIPITADTIAHRFNALVNKAGPRPKDSQLRLLERLQASFYAMESDGDKPEEDLNIPQTKEFLMLQLNEQLFLLQQRLITADTFFYWIGQQGLQKGLNAETKKRMVYCRHIYAANRYFHDHALRDEENYAFASFRKETLHLVKQKKLFKGETDNLFSEEVLTYLLRQFKQKREMQHYKPLRLFYLIGFVKEKMGDPREIGHVDQAVSEIWRMYVQHETLTDDERIDWAMFFNLFEKLNWSLELLRPLVDRPSPDHFALCLSLSVEAALHDNMTITPKLLAAAHVLTDEEWCSLLTSGYFLPTTLLEDYTLRKVYQAKLRNLGATPR